MIISDGSKINLIIRRMKCPHCGRIHHELPDCIVPYKRYSVSLIVAVVKGSDEATDIFPGETSTTARLRSWFRLFQNYVNRMRNHYLLLFNVDVHSLKLKTVGGMKRIVRILANTNFWPQTRFAMIVHT